MNNIGNVVPLDAGTNVAGSNSDWDIKRALYRSKVPTWLACRIGDDNPDGWTPAKIQKRAADIADWAVTQRWNVDEALAAL